MRLQTDQASICLADRFGCAFQDRVLAPFDIDFDDHITANIQSIDGRDQNVARAIHYQVARVIGAIGIRYIEPPCAAGVRDRARDHHSSYREVCKVPFEEWQNFGVWLDGNDAFDSRRDLLTESDRKK